MNLERIEEKCLSYLGQVGNPIVPVDTLLRHLWQEDEFQELTRADLLSFLRKHELVHVVEVDTDDGRSGATRHGRDLAEAGLASGPRVVLKSRMPTKAELSEMIEAQLAAMKDALQKALQEAASEGDNGACAKIQEVLNRTENLRDQLGKVL